MSVDMVENVKKLERLEFDVPSLRSIDNVSDIAYELAEEAVYAYLQSPKGDRASLDAALRDMEDAMMQYERVLCIMKRLVELMEKDVQFIAFPMLEDYDAALAHNGVL